MDPNNISIIAVSNPSDDGTHATIIAREAYATPESVIARYGDQIANGALVSIADRDERGNTTGVYLYIADRESHPRALQLRSNATIADYVDIEDVGEAVAEGGIVPELETFTVYGTNDDGEAFVAVVSATEDTVHDVGVAAGLVDEGFEHSVAIHVILKGDTSETEVITASDAAA